MMIKKIIHYIRYKVFRMKPQGRLWWYNCDFGSGVAFVYNDGIWEELDTTVKETNTSIQMEWKDKNAR